MFKRTTKIAWKNYMQHEELVDSSLVITIHGDAMVDDLFKSIFNFMSVSGMDHKYKVTISKVEEEI